MSCVFADTGPVEGLTEALTRDHHFGQAGFTALLLN